VVGAPVCGLNSVVVVERCKGGSCFLGTDPTGATEKGTAGGGVPSRARGGVRGRIPDCEGRLSPGSTGPGWLRAGGRKTI